MQTQGEASPLHDAGEVFWVVIASGPGGNHPGDLKIVEDARKRLPIRVATVNNMYQYIRPDLIYSHDEWWWRQHYERARQTGAALVCADSNTTIRHGVTMVRARHHAGISRERDYVSHGGNSGHQVINLLRNHGVVNMALLGFVFGKVDGEQRCHRPHKKHAAEPNYSEWRANMARLAAALAAEGVSVTNCSRHTRIDSFKTSPIWVWANRVERSIKPEEDAS